MLRISGEAVYNNFMFYAYILASANNTAVYVGSTDDLVRRVWEHKNHVVDGHTEKYHIQKLIYFELHDTREEAQLREKRIKRWRRAWKDELIAKNNPQ